jgi:hypothetical protein
VGLKRHDFSKETLQKKVAAGLPPSLSVWSQHLRGYGASGRGSPGLSRSHVPRAIHQILPAGDHTMRLHAATSQPPVRKAPFLLLPLIPPTLIC